MSWKAAMHLGEIEKLDKAIERTKAPIEYFRPMIKVPVFRGGRVITEQQPLFFNYIFVRTLGGDIEQITRRLRKVLVWVQFGGRIATVSEETISQIRLRSMQVEDHARKHFKAIDFGDLNRGETVEVVNGPFGGVYGTVIGTGARGTVKLHVNCFRRTTLVEVKVDDVELV